MLRSRLPLPKIWLAGPHDIEMSMNARRPRSLKVHHEILSGRLQNLIKYTVDGREQFVGELSGKVEGQLKELQIDSELKIKSEFRIKNLKQMNIKVNHKHSLRRGSFEVDSQLRGNVEDGKMYEAKLSSKMTKVRGEGETTFSAALSTPVRNYEHQSVEGQFKCNPERALLNVKSVDGHKRSLEICIPSYQTTGQVRIPFRNQIRIQTNSLEQTPDDCRQEISFLDHRC